MAVIERYAPPKQGRSQAKLERLLAAGRELFAERGFDGTHVDEVVRRAGCSVGVFYHRFGDKDAFFAAVQQHFLDEVTATGAEVNARASELGAVELLRAHIARGVRLFRRNAGLVRAFLHYETSHPSFDLPMRAVVAESTERLVEALRAAGTPIGHPDPAIAIPLGAQVMRAALVHEALHDTGTIRLDDEVLVDELTRMFAAYLGIA